MSETTQVAVEPPPKCRVCGHFLMQDGRCMGAFISEVNSVRAHRTAKAIRK